MSRSEQDIYVPTLEERAEHIRNSEDLANTGLGFPALEFGEDYTYSDEILEGLGDKVSGEIEEVRTGVIQLISD